MQFWDIKSSAAAKKSSHRVVEEVSTHDDGIHCPGKSDFFQDPQVIPGPITLW